MQPRRYGGYEAGVPTSLDVMTAIAQGDGATAWVTSLANHSAWDLGLCSTRVQDEVFGANADSLVCGSLAPAGTAVAVDGGVRLSGRWGYVSGSLHAQWAVLGVNVEDETVLANSPPWAHWPNITKCAASTTVTTSSATPPKPWT
jgi:3-hydroxy-9,10-secoandrosta-1,3,5(10)-triene-9,17-dione monooxygenase